MLRLNVEDYSLLKVNAELKGCSMNLYLVELIRTDSHHDEGAPDKMELLRTVRDSHNSSKDLLVYNYVILKLGAAILRFFYTADPSDEGMENAIKFVNRKLDEARVQFT